MSSGLWKDITRSTEEEHKRFRKALNSLMFTKEEFVLKGPSIIFEKFHECIKILESKND